MRLATSPHHTNPRSTTLDFWRKTSDMEEYRKLQARRKKQVNKPTSSTHNKQEHMIIAHRMAAMEKRRIGTRFLDHEVTDADRQKPLAVIVQEKCESCSIMWINSTFVLLGVSTDFVTSFSFSFDQAFHSEICCVFLFYHWHKLNSSVTVLLARLPLTKFEMQRCLSRLIAMTMTSCVLHNRWIVICTREIVWR